MPSHHNCPIEKNVPGWREEVKPCRVNALFWHSIWKSAGCPNKGVLRDIMGNTRIKYHYAIRKVKKLAETIRATKLLDAANDGGFDLLN